MSATDAETAPAAHRDTPASADVSADARSADAPAATTAGETKDSSAPDGVEGGAAAIHVGGVVDGTADDADADADASAFDMMERARTLSGHKPASPDAAAHAGPSRTQSVELSWADLTVEVPVGGCGGGKKTKTILHGVSGSITPGALCAIMGPSGAGKSTLLNTLAGRLRGDGVSGKIMADGKTINPAAFRSHIAYVMQEDALFPTQTPREAFEFSAAMRLPPSVSASERKGLVDAMLTSLGLDKCADTMIGSIMLPGISGGEKKRTAIGVELISDPDVLFLDEPTSGLDSFAAFQVVKILQRLAKSGRTVVTTIHQPSSEVFACFDAGILLVDGRMVYNDTVKGLTSYFDGMGHPCPPLYNPADHVMFVMQQLDAEGIATFQEAWAKRDAELAASKTIEDAAATTSDGDAAYASGEFAGGDRAGFLKQFMYLGRREAQKVLRDKGSMAGRIGVTMFLNLIVGFVFQGAADWADTSLSQPAVIGRVNSHFGALVQVSIGGLFGLSQPTMLEFPLERPIFLREYATGTYGVAAYFLSKLLVEVPLMIFQSSIIFLCTYWLVGFDANFMLMTLIVALLGLVAASTALVIGAMADNVQVAIQIAPLLFVPQLLFAGFFIPITQIPEWLRWAQYLCSLKYSLNLVVLTEFDSSDQQPPSSFGDTSEEGVHMFQDAIYGCHGDTLGSDGLCSDTSGPAYANALLPRSEIEPPEAMLYLGVLLAVLAGMRFIAFNALVNKARRS